MKKAIAFVCSRTTGILACAMVILCLSLIVGTAMPLFAQSSTQGNTTAGRYGNLPWAQANQRYASVFNYDIDSIYGSGLGAFTFPAVTCTGALSFGGNNNKNPFATNASVQIVDITAANTETIALNSITFSGGNCVLSLANVNAHSSYHLRSGTCGLREALNDLGINGGTVFVDQKFYDDGCTAATITGLTLAGGLRAHQYIVDISNGLPGVKYQLQALNNTALSVAGAALTATLASGGALTTGGTYLLNYQYVDCLGGQGLANTESATITLTGIQTITTSAVAAATGACGFIPTITASGGSTGTEIAVANPLTSATCTLSTTTPYPTCAIGSTVFINANPSGTSKQNVENFGHTSVGYLPVSGDPSISPITVAGAGGAFQTSYLPFVASATLNNSSADLAQALIPAGYFNRLGGTWDVCIKGNVSTAVAASILKLTLTMTNNYAQNPVVESTVLFPTLTLAAAGTFQGCFEIKTGVTGAAGRFWASSPGAWGFVLNSTGLGVSTVDNTAALSTATNAPDLTKPIFLSVTATETGSQNITVPLINAMTIKPVPSN